MGCPLIERSKNPQSVHSKVPPLPFAFPPSVSGGRPSSPVSMPLFTSLQLPPFKHP